MKDIRSKKIESIRKLGQRLGFWSHGYGYPMNCRQIFGEARLEGKYVLEIGCGKGLLCIWASIQGASRVVGLEPLRDGSGSFNSSRIYKEFKEMVKTADLKDIDMLPLRVQEYKSPDDYFDIVLMMASVNHVDENSCIKLKESEPSRESYRNVFKGISSIMNKGGKIILTDCSDRNFFADMGVVNPFARSIEWFKHQSPEYWAELLSQCGFGDPKITWPAGRYLRYLGINHRNKWISYFINSSFRLEMTCLKEKK